MEVLNILTLQQNNNRTDVKIYCIEDLVPKKHILRKIDRIIDFNFIYPLLESLYCTDNGRPSINPVVLFKIVLIQYLFSIRSIRQTIREIEVNIAYRWFLGYSLDDRIPHFTTFGKNYERRFKDTDIFENIFQNILAEAIKKGFVDPKAVFVDSTHVKANANKKKFTKETLEIEMKAYQQDLEKEIAEERENNGKKD